METFKPLQDEILKALVATTRSASHIAAADVEFQKSLNPPVGEQLDAQNARLLLLAQRLLENAAASSDAVGPKLPDVEAVDANWRGIVDVVDSLLEKADTSLDEYTGVVKRLSPAGEQANVTSRPNIADRKHIAKPQLEFEHIPTNDETGGFFPLLASKPHARIPLAECLKTFQDRRGREQYPHPYQSEIEQYDYPSSVYQQSKPQQYPPFESTTATFVDTFEAVETMLEELKKAKEIAVDLEHHDNRSYIGMVSLMQISTRDKDWIVDTLKPWRRKLECLNEVFTDPGIVKVLHGAYMDVIWLQRDLGLYLVGLFDTFHAARILGYPGASLAYLLSRFVQFQAQKQYQIADWRQRPLSKELFEYARADTHFLLYVYDNMRNELVTKSDFSDPEKNKVQDVLQRSKETALQRYEHPIYDTELGLGPVGWYKLISRTPVQFTPQQFSVFRAVHQWRDNLSRKEDESPLFIMPNHAVFSIARAMPADKAALFSAIQHVSHVIRAKADELVGVITEAKKAGTNGPELHDVLKTIDDMRDARHSAPQSPPEVQKAPQPAAAQLAPSSGAVPQSSEASRAPTSTFWGKLWSKNIGAQERSMSTLSIDLALPLPPLTAELFTDSNGVNSDATPRAEKIVPTFVPKDERPLVDERSDLFVIKQLGGKKRKRNDTIEESTSSTPALDNTQDEVMLDQESEEAVRARAKAAKKALKKERKRQEAAEAEAARNNEPAFDYTTAPSVLHAHDAEGKKGKKDKKKKGFTPFAGMSDAPKGLPRAQKEKAGKSKTFTS